MTERPRDALDASFAQRWFAEFGSEFAGQATVLASLDRQAGDGDFGANLTSALAKAEGFIARLEPDSFAGVFDAISKGFLNTGGTSGPLFGMWFREISKAALTEPLGVASLAAGVEGGLAVIQRLGKAKVGDNTMVDAMAPAAGSLVQSRDDGRPLGASLADAALAARSGAESTRAMIASRGRASYVGELARGVLDPGAVTVALFFQAAAVVHGALDRDTGWLTS